MQRTDPFTAILRHIQGGTNPNTLLEQMSRSDPRYAQALGMLRGKNEQQLRTMARNMARERGTTVEEIARGLGLKLPK